MKGLQGFCLIVSFFGLGWLQTSCLEKPKSEVKAQDFPLLVRGRIQDSLGRPGAGISIYIEQENDPVQVSADDGSFALRIDSAQMRDLRVKYAPLGQPLRLYFQQGDSPRESAVFDQLQQVYIGDLNLGVVQLQPEIIISGQVRAAKRLEESNLPVEGAVVRVGRNSTLTDIDGRFAVYAPARSQLPVLITQTGYVQTRGTWNVGALTDIRDFELYDRLNVEGRIALPTSFRNDNPAVKSITLAISTNVMSQWVRLALDPNDFAQVSSSRSPWQSLDGAIEIPLSEGTPQQLYYQFADRDKKVLSDISTLDLSFPRFQPASP